MRQGLDTGEVEEAAAPLHCVNEAEYFVEPCRISRLRLPRDKRLGNALERLPSFRDELACQLIHHYRVPKS